MSNLDNLIAKVSHEVWSHSICLSDAVQSLYKGAFDDRILGEGVVHCVIRETATAPSLDAIVFYF